MRTLCNRLVYDSVLPPVIAANNDTASPLADMASNLSPQGNPASRIAKKIADIKPKPINNTAPSITTKSRTKYLRRFFLIALPNLDTARMSLFQDRRKNSVSIILYLQFREHEKSLRVAYRCGRSVFNEWMALRKRMKYKSVNAYHQAKTITAKQTPIANINSTIFIKHCQMRCTIVPNVIPGTHGDRPRETTFLQGLCGCARRRQTKRERGQAPVAPLC